MSSERKKFSLRNADAGNGKLPPQMEAQLRQALNPEQVEAVLDFSGLQLILAGAGTGKTRTLVWRVAALVASGIPADQILLLTFTRKAAQEMLHRVGTILGQGKIQVQGGTFHSWAAMTLRRHGRSVGLGPSFTIADSSDTEDIVGMLRTRMGFGGKERRFLQKSSLARIFSRHANHGTPIEDILAEEYPRSLEEFADIQALYAAFTEWKHTHQIVDYDDLMLQSFALLKQDTATLDILRKVHRYILVDEFQDTNTIQAQIVKILAGDMGNLTVVGDECQGIYSFRGADPKSILRFPTENPLCKVHSLTRNYRSTQNILDTANALMGASAESFGKTLTSNISPTDSTSATQPVLAHCSTFEDQARFVAERIRQLHEEGISLNQMAVLFRSASHSAELEITLQRKGIPFRKFGGIRFVEAAHIKDLVAMLRLVGNSRDGISWQRVLLLLPGVGTSTAESILLAMDATERPLEALREPKFSARKFAANLRALADFLESTSPDQSPAILMEKALGVAKPWIEDHYHDDAHKRMSDLNTLIEISKGYGELDSFLSELSLDPPERTGTIDSSLDQDENLTLSTIHSAKGLEWRVVFILSLLEGHLPSYYSLRKQEQVEEERRLFYVALTRAERELYCCLPENAFLNSSKIQEIGIPSRFLDDIPTTIFDHWDIEG
jgi:DNA helicase-2/ATP-dependent DNA helicase PcrA